MRNVLGVAGCIVSCAILAACAANAPPAPPMTAVQPTADAALPASAIGSVDGVYRPPVGGVSGNSRCGTTKFGFPIRVTGGMASMASATNGTLEGPVGPDGSLSIEKGRAGLRGQFANGQFNGTYISGSCSYSLVYNKR